MLKLTFSKGNDMICSWSLLHDVLNGTLDDEYPIMNNFKSAEDAAQWVNENGGYEYTPDPDDPRNYPENGNYVYESPDGGKTVTRRKAGSLDKEVVQRPPYKQPGTPLDEYLNKPSPDLVSYNAHRKYQEDKGLKDLSDYVSSTYNGHYTNEGSNVQTLDLIHSVGDAESFCRSNAIKYLSRYDKKGQAKRDILKAMHYCLLLYYFSGHTNDETPTRGYETF